MKKLTRLALAVSLALALPHAAADTPAQPTAETGSRVDDGLAAGLDMMLLNSSLLRNGDNVWQRVREGFQLSEVNPELVRRHERAFAARPDGFRRSLERSRKYLFHIMNEVEKRGMPTEIALLPVVESAFVPTAQSPVGAAGLWQFMPATGRQYGLEQTWWYDGRRDVIEATRAALDYLQNLYTMFGDWNLALAAYNWGEGNLGRAIAKVRARGELESYENIQMPNETRNYVPKLLAVRNLLQAPEQFGLKITPLPNKPTFVAVSNGRHMNIDIAARLAEMPVSEFKELNPAFNLPVYAHKGGRQMLLPAGKLHRFETNLAKWDKPLLTWQVHVPDSDTSVSQLASQFEMNPNELIAANSVRGDAPLPAGRPVLVAANGRAGSAPALENTDVAAPPAEVATLVAFAAGSEPPRQSVTAPAPVSTTVPQLARATPAPLPPEPRNDSKAEVIKVARSEAVKNAPLRSETAAAVPSAALHTVATGDTLYNISRRYGMSVADLKQLNDLADDTVRQGQSLRVIGTLVAAHPVALDPSALRTVAYSPRQTTTAPSSLDYVVQRGDTLFSIARQFGVSHTDILRWNDPAQLQTLHPGQKVRVLQAER